MATTKSPPGLLRRAYNEKTFKKRIVGGVYLAQDRAFLASAFARDGEGIYRLREDLNAGDYQRVTSLAKQIRKNRGSLKSGRIVVVALIIGSIVLFNLLFKNALLTRAGERTLQSVFEAEAEIRDLNLRLLQGELSYANLAVADRDRPFRNLFEIGPTVVDISLEELLKGNFVAHTLSVQNIRWNTERSDSGRPATAALPRPDVSDPSGGGVDALSIPALSPEDAQAFLMQHYQQLNVPRLIEDAERRLAEAANELPRRLDANVARLEQLTTSIQRADAIRPQQIDSLETAILTYRELQTLTDTVRQNISAIETELDHVREQAAVANEIWAELGSAVESDIAYLADRITDVGADPAAFLMNIVAELVRQQFGDLFRYRDRALEVASMVRGGEPGEPGVPFRPGGTDIVYPSVTWPRFYLGLASISFAAEESGAFQAGSISDLTSAPRLIGRPTAVDLRTLRDGRSHRFDALLSLHRDDGDLLQLEYRGEDLPLKLSTALGAVTLRELAGRSTITTSALLDRDGTLRGEAEISVFNPEFALTTGVPVIDQIIAEAVDRAEEIGVNFSYVAREHSIITLRGSTSLDRHVAAGVRDYIDQQRATFEARLRQEVADLAAAGRAELEPLENIVVALRADAQAELERAREYRRTVERQLAAADKRVTELQSQAERRARDEAERQIESIIEDAPLPRIDTGRIPRLR